MPLRSLSPGTHGRVLTALATGAGLDKRAAGGRADSHGQAHTDGVAWLLATGRAVAPATAADSSDPSD